MGREVKRVALDFVWPRNKVWEGFVNPHHVSNCGECDGMGVDESYESLTELVNLLLLAGDASLMRKPLHPYFGSTRLERVGPKLHEVMAGLTGQDPGPFGFLGSAYRAVPKLIAAAGLPETWGRCEACGGEGYAPGQEEAIRQRDEWQQREPPTGEGWQLWETVSEGSPITPVFATPEELARWLVRNDDSITRGRSFEQWMALLTGPGWAPSMMATPETGLVSGVEAMAREELKR